MTFVIQSLQPIHVLRPDATGLKPVETAFVQHGAVMQDCSLEQLQTSQMMFPITRHVDMGGYSPEKWLEVLIFRVLHGSAIDFVLRIPES